MNQLAGVVYAGFWIRLGASLIDSILIMLLTSPIVYAIYGPEYFTDNKQLIAGGWDFLITWVLPAVAVIVFWIYRSATPGKIILGIRIVDAQTGGKPSTGQLVGRYFAYYVSTLPLMLGFLWIAFDKRKQGWHDKLAGTVVIEDDTLD
jgi:uncharacterized RDD family membrane protein YckC